MTSGHLEVPRVTDLSAAQIIVGNFVPTSCSGGEAAISRRAAAYARSKARRSAARASMRCEPAVAGRGAPRSQFCILGGAVASVDAAFPCREDAIPTAAVAFYALHTATYTAGDSEADLLTQASRREPARRCTLTLSLSIYIRAEHSPTKMQCERAQSPRRCAGGQRPRAAIALARD